MASGAGPFLPQGHNFNNRHGRGPLGDATYQISRHGLVLSDKKNFKVFISENLFLAHVTLICNRPLPFEQLLKRAI